MPSSLQTSAPRVRITIATNPTTEKPALKKDFSNVYHHELNYADAFIRSGDLKIVSQSGKVLGLITDRKYDSDSILNEYGKGSKYESDSIFNQYGTYGSAYSDESPWYKYASKPPYLVSGGKIIGVLTSDRYTAGAVDPCKFLTQVFKRAGVNDLPTVLKDHCK